MLDKDQVTVSVIMGEIKPVVEPDHDPVGGCNSSISLDYKSIPFIIIPPAPVKVGFHLLPPALAYFHTYINCLCRMHKW